jgi:hypothetical protein
MRIAIAVAALLLAGCGARTIICIFDREPDLSPGGVFVAYNLGCERGCGRLGRGDLIQTIDGRTVRTGEEFDDANVTDGRPHTLGLLRAYSHDSESVVIVARPKDDMPPLVDVPPLWTVSAEKLNAAPDWARRRMFGHAIPMVLLESAEGESLDGRRLYGHKHLIVCWDRADRTEEGYALSFMQVLQKAQADLAGAGVDIMFARVRFPGGTPPPSGVELAAWAGRWSLAHDGAKLPMIPLYRVPESIDPARELGLENAYSIRENLGQSPAILLVDERGIVRWHSEGIQTPPADAQLQNEQYTIIEAVTFALARL